MKFFYASLFIFSLFLMSSCSPKSSQPCPHVYKQVKKAPIDIMLASTEEADLL
jgi:hypothetical protein